MAGTEFVIDCDRVLLAIGQGPKLDWLERGSDGVGATKNRRLAADAVTFATGRRGRVRHRRRAHRRGDGGRGRRRGSPRRVRHRRLPEGPGPRRDQDAPDAGRAAARVPLHRALHGRGQGAALPPQGDGRRGAQQELRRVRDPVHAGRRRWPSRSAASSARARRSATATCAARASSTARRSTTLEPERSGAFSFRSVSENRFTGTNHDYIRDDSHAFILREPSRCIDCGRCANVCKEVVGAACYDFMRTGFDTLVTTPLDMSLNTTPCVSLRPLRRDLPDRRADAQAARPREVRGRREPLHPVRHLRRRLPLRRAALRARLRAQPREPRGADDRPAGDQRRSTATPRSATSARSATGSTRAQAERPRSIPRTDCCRCCPPASAQRQRARSGTATRATATRRLAAGHAHAAHGHDAAITDPPAASTAPGADGPRPAPDRPVPRLALGRPALPARWPGSCSAAALLVVLGRDIIRSGLCDGARVRGPGRHLRAARRGRRGRRAGAHLHRRDQRPHPVRDHAHADEVRAGCSSSSTARVGRRLLAAIGVALLLIISGHQHAVAAARRRAPVVADAREVALLLFNDVRLRLQVVAVLLLAAVIGGVFLAKREG